MTQQDIAPMAAKPRFVRAWMDEREIPYTKMKAIVDPDTGEKELRPTQYSKTVERLMVTYIPNPHDQHGRTEINKCWDDLVPRAELENANTFEGLSVRLRYEALKPHIEAYRSGKLIEGTNGTPLADVPGVTEAVANLLRKHEIFSAEDLAEAAELQIRKVQHPEIRKFVRRAQDKMREKTIIASANKDQTDRLAKMEAENKALREMMEQFMASQKAPVAPVAAQQKPADNNQNRKAA